jgi:hypothetical protein
MNRACQVHTTGLHLPDRVHDLGRAAALRSSEDDLGAPHVLLRRVAIRDDRLERRRSSDVTFTVIPALDNESLNCFGRFGNRPK